MLGEADMLGYIMPLVGGFSTKLQCSTGPFLGGRRMDDLGAPVSSLLMDLLEISIILPCTCVKHSWIYYDGMYI